MLDPREPEKLVLPPLFREISERRLILALLSLSMVLPFILAAAGLDKKMIFHFPPSENETFPYYERKIFDEPGDIDLLFVGPCTIWWHVRPENFVKPIEDRWKRRVSAVNLGFNHYSNDLSYLLVRETLRRHRVKYLVLSTPRRSDPPTFPHPNAYQWWNYPTDAGDLRDLSWKAHLQLYAASVMGGFRFLPQFFLPHGSPPWPGSGVTATGTKIRPSKAFSFRLTPTWAPGDLIFDHFTSDLRWDPQAPLLPEQLALLKSIQTLAQEHGTRLVWLSSPLKEDFQDDFFSEREDWFQKFPGARLLALPPGWIKKNASNWEQLFEGQNLTMEASAWMSEKWGEGFAAAFPDF